jgi:predicted nicotinamide N-methyase
MAPSARAFVLRHTRFQQVPGLDGIRLHLADDVLALWHATQEATGDPDAPVPYWAFAWGGGLAIARYLRDHPDVVAGRRVLDVASGSGLCAIAAMRGGAAAATAVDIDPFAVAAIRINTRANGHRLDAVCGDILDEEPPDVDLILAGDCWYEERFAARITAWLRRASDRGIDVRIGDPDRRYLPRDAFRAIATYEVRTTTDLEDLGRTRASVHELRERPASPVARTHAP